MFSSLHYSPMVEPYILVPTLYTSRRSKIVLPLILKIASEILCDNYKRYYSMYYKVVITYLGSISYYY